MGDPTVKPWNLDTIREKMDLVKKSGAFAVALDVDAAGLPFLKNMDPPAGGKSVEDLKAIAEMAGAPFIVKGVMTVKGALKARKREQQPLLYPITADVYRISARQQQKFFLKS